MNKPVPKVKSTMSPICHYSENSWDKQLRACDSDSGG